MSRRKCCCSGVEVLCPNRCTGTPPETIQVSISGIENGSLCSNCTALNGTYTLTSQSCYFNDVSCRTFPPFLGACTPSALSPYLGQNCCLWSAMAGVTPACYGLDPTGNPWSLSVYTVQGTDGTWAVIAVVTTVTADPLSTMVWWQIFAEEPDCSVLTNLEFSGGIEAGCTYYEGDYCNPDGSTVVLNPSPAAACSECATTPKTITVGFTADTNVSGSGCGCGPCHSLDVSVAAPTPPGTLSSTMNCAPFLAGKRWTTPFTGGEWFVQIDQMAGSVTLALYLVIGGNNYVYANESLPLGCPAAGTYTVTTTDAPPGWPGSVDITLTETGDITPDCSSWGSVAVELVQLPQVTVDNLNVLNPTVWPLATRTTGCYYGTFGDLPCGATYMVAEILDGGADGSAVMKITIGWSTSDYVTITVTHAISPESDDCCANFSWTDESAATIALSIGGAPTCDFGNLPSWTSDMTITAAC